MNTKRLEKTKKICQSAMEKLYSDRDYFIRYLKYSGRFYKIHSAQIIPLFENNPNAFIFADYDTWKKYGNSVKSGEHSSAALADGGKGLKHYFDFNQTTARNIPFQWYLDKEIAEEFLKSEERAVGKKFRNVATYINASAVKAVSDNAERIFADFPDITDEDRKAFLYSVSTMVMTEIAARCEHRGTYKYQTPHIPDLTALGFMKSKEDTVKLCEAVHRNAQSVLYKTEKSITQIINIRIEEMKNEREQARNEQANRGMEQQAPQHKGSTQGAAQRERSAENGILRGNRRVVSDVHGSGEGVWNDSVQAEPAGELHLQRSDERGGTGGRTDRDLRGEVAEVYEGELSERSNDDGDRQLRFWGGGEDSGQRSQRDVRTTGRTVSKNEPPSHNVLGDSQVGENETVGDRPRGNGNGGTPISGQPDNGNNIKEEAAEVLEEAPSAFSVYRLNADDVIKVDDKENPVCHGVVEKMSDKEIEIGLYHLEDSAFCSKFGSIHCDFETLEQKYDCEYVGKAADIRRADYKENIGIYAAFANHDIVHLEMPSEEKEEYPVQNANLKKFENLRIEYNEVEGERGFVLKGDTDRADDLILASYGEISPQQIYLEIKKYNLTVGDIEKQRISPFSVKPEKQSTDIPEQQSADISDNQSADTPENERATNSTINAVRLY